MVDAQEAQSSQIRGQTSLRPPNNAAAHVREEYPNHDLVGNVPDALEIVKQYMLEKETLPAADPQKENSGR